MQFPFGTAAQSSRSVPSPARLELALAPSLLRSLSDEIACVLLPVIHCDFGVPKAKRGWRNLNIMGRIAVSEIPEPEEPAQTFEHVPRSEQRSGNETPVGHGRPFPK